VGQWRAKEDANDKTTTDDRSFEITKCPKHATKKKEAGGSKREGVSPALQTITKFPGKKEDTTDSMRGTQILMNASKRLDFALEKGRRKFEYWF